MRDLDQMTAERRRLSDEATRLQRADQWDAADAVLAQVRVLSRRIADTVEVADA